VLDQPPVAEDGVVEVGDVADGPDAGDVAREALVDEHRAPLELDGGALEVRGGRLHADADDRELRLDLPSVLRGRPGQLAVAPAELRHAVAQDQLGPRARG